MKNLILLFSLAVVFAACDKISKDGVYEQAPPITSQKKVLLEIFTGWKCVNCPEQTEAALNSIKKNGYDDNVIIMKVHAGFFAVPSSKTIDLRCPAGDALSFSLGISGNPMGVVNRTKFATGYSISSGDWASKVIGAVTKDTAYAPLDFELSIEYSDVTRRMALKTNATLTRDINKGVDILAYITEDSIINSQILPKSDQFPKGVDTAFVHRHTMRTQLQAKGDNTLLANAAKKDDKIAKTFVTFTLPDNWKDRHCAVVVLAVNKSDGQVIQASEMLILQ